MRAGGRADRHLYFGSMIRSLKANMPSLPPAGNISPLWLVLFTISQLLRVHTGPSAQRSPHQARAPATHCEEGKLTTGSDRSQQFRYMSAVHTVSMSTALPLARA